MTDREIQRAGDCRHATLRVMHARQGLALREVAIAQALAADGYDFEPHESSAALAFLVAEGLVSKAFPRLQAIPVFEITPAGVLLIERGG